MSNNSKVKSVVTTNSDIDNMSAEDQARLFQALTARLAGTPLALEAEKTLHTTNTVVVEQRSKEIDAEISTLREEIGTRNERIKLLMAEKSSLGLKTSGSTDSRTRNVTACPSCGQGRHAENDKTAACTIYPGFKAAVEAAKNNKVAVPTFSTYLASQVQ